MSRILYLSPHPQNAIPRYRQNQFVLTPNLQAAKKLRVLHRSIDALGKSLLESAGVSIADAASANRLLLTSVENAITPRNPRGQLHVFRPVVNELLRTGVSVENLRTSGSSPTHRLADVLEAYLAALRTEGLIDEAESLWRAADVVTEQRSVLVVGYPRVGPADLAFLDRIAGEGSVLFLPYTSQPLFEDNRRAATILEERGWVVQEGYDEPVTLGERVAQRYVDSTAPCPSLTAHVFPDLEAEVRGALARVKGFLHDGVPVADIVLVARDERSYGPLLKAVAWEYGVPVRLRYRIPLAETRIGAWLLLLAEVLSDPFSFEPTARFLAHPFANGLNGDAWRAARKLHPQDASDWMNCGADVSPLIWPESGTWPEYVARLRQVLASYECGNHTTLEGSDRLALEVLTLDLASPPGTPTTSIALATFLGELRVHLRQLTVPISTESVGVELHSPLAVFGAHYRHVIVLGLAEGLFPPTLTDPPLLDFYERKVLADEGVTTETAREAAQRERLSFWALLGTATESLTLSYPQQTGRQHRLPSSYFAALGFTPTKPGRSPLASPEEARAAWLQDAQKHNDEVLTSARAAWAVEYRRESGAVCDVYDGVIGIPFNVNDLNFSASYLIWLGQCPFRWYHHQALGLREPREADEDLHPTTRGRLYHKALEEALSAALGAENVREAARQALPAAFAAAEDVVDLPLLPNWSQRRREHLERLERVLEADDFLPAGQQILTLEQSFEVNWHGLSVRGIVDRIDEDVQGRVVVIDYKTSASKPKGAKDASGRANLDVQLPIYLHAVREKLFENREVAGGYYYSLTKQEDRRFADAEIDQDGLADLAARVKAHLSEGSFPVDPDLDAHACTYCEFDLICRRGPRIERKRRRDADS